MCLDGKNEKLKFTYGKASRPFAQIKISQTEIRLCVHLNLVTPLLNERKHNFMICVSQVFQLGHFCQIAVWKVFNLAGRWWKF